MTIPYVLKHSKKARHLRMQISNNGELEVVLPRGFQIIDAEKFIYKKLDWIKKYLSQYRQSRNKFSLLGRDIKVTQNYDLFIKNHKVKFGNDHLIITSPSGSKVNNEEMFEKWLRKAIPDRVDWPGIRRSRRRPKGRMVGGSGKREGVILISKRRHL